MGWTDGWKNDAKTSTILQTLFVMDNYLLQYTVYIKAGLSSKQVSCICDAHQ